MKKQFSIKLGRGIAVTAFVTLGLANFAQADGTNFYKEEGVLYSGYFSSLGSGGKTPEFDQSQYDKVNLGPLSSTLWAPKRGAQGPMRGGDGSMMHEDGASKLAQQTRDIERQLGPIGGRNTP